MNIRPGDYISVYYDEDANLANNLLKQLSFTGLVIDVIDSKKHVHPFSRWWTLNMLFNCEIKEINVYWDDKIEIHARL